MFDTDGESGFDDAENLRQVMYKYMKKGTDLEIILVSGDTTYTGKIVVLGSDYIQLQDIDGAEENVITEIIPIEKICSIGTEEPLKEES